MALFAKPKENIYCKQVGEDNTPYYFRRDTCGQWWLWCSQCTVEDKTLSAWEYNRKKNCISKWVSLWSWRWKLILNKKERFENPWTTQVSELEVLLVCGPSAVET
jgi:hypothetical protein